MRIGFTSTRGSTEPIVRTAMTAEVLTELTSAMLVVGSVPTSNSPVLLALPSTRHYRADTARQLRESASPSWKHLEREVLNATIPT